MHIKEIKKTIRIGRLAKYFILGLDGLMIGFFSGTSILFESEGR